MHIFYFGIEENINGQFRTQNCKLYWAYELINQALDDRHTKPHMPLFVNYCCVL